MAKPIDPAIIDRLSEPCIDELKNSVEKGLLKQKDCLQLTKEISKKVHNDVNDSIKRKGYSASTITVLLTSWFKHKPMEVWMVTLLNVLKSHNIDNDALRSLAQRLEEIYTNIRKFRENEEVQVNGDGNNNEGSNRRSPASPQKCKSSFERSEFQASKRLAQQAQRDKEEARRLHKEANKKEEAANKKEEAVLAMLKNTHISPKKKVNCVHLD